MQKVIITRGLPASGKSTYARRWVSRDRSNRVQVEKDQIRKDARLFKGEYNHKRGDEKIVLRERDRIIRQALEQGKSVVVSDTNLFNKHVTQITEIANEFKARVEVKDFLDIPLAELIERDSKREESVGEQVIRKMFHQNLKTLPTFLRHDPNLDYVVVCDIDGTLTMGPKGRSAYEWKKVGNDDINLGTSAIIDGINSIGLYKVLLFSGRDEVCRPETEEWLERHGIDYEALYMRPHGSNEKDTVIKANMIESHIKGKYNVLLWMDDRPQIVRMLNDVYGINVMALGDQRCEF